MIVSEFPSALWSFKVLVTIHLHCIYLYWNIFLKIFIWFLLKKDIHTWPAGEFREELFQKLLWDCMILLVHTSRAYQCFVILFMKGNWGQMQISTAGWCHNVEGVEINTVWFQQIFFLEWGHILRSGTCSMFYSEVTSYKSKDQMWFLVTLKKNKIIKNNINNK